jgi:hypothetical protein
MFDDEDDIQDVKTPDQIEVDKLLLKALDLYDILEKKLIELGLEEEEDENKYPPELKKMLDEIDSIQAKIDILLPSEESLEAYE